MAQAGSIAPEDIEPVISPNVFGSCFCSVDVEEHISLLPCFIGRLSQGVIEHLNRKVFRYSKERGGVLLSYSKPKVIQKNGVIFDEQPHIHFDLKYTACLFKPLIGSLLSGVINNIGEDHIGCLVHNCFNASVLPADNSGHQGSWNLDNFTLGSTVWFTVQNLTNVDGIVSISGAFVDLNQQLPTTHVNEGHDTSSDDNKGHRKKRQSKKNDRSYSIDDDNMSAPAKKRKHSSNKKTRNKKANSDT